MELERIYRICGAPIRFRFRGGADALIRPRIAHTEDADAAPVGTIELVADRDHFTVALDGTTLGSAADEAAGIDLIVDAVLRLSYPDADWLTVMHAAAVGDDRGAVVLLGASRVGKSTLTAALVAAGLRYCSDDVVPLDRAMRVRPVPISIDLRQGSWPAVRQFWPEFDHLPVEGGLWPRRHLRIATDRIALPSGLPLIAVVTLEFAADRSIAMARLPVADLLAEMARAHARFALGSRRFGLDATRLGHRPGHRLRYPTLTSAVSAISGLLADPDP